jgi:hypothetical protein
VRLNSLMLAIFALIATTLPVVDVPAIGQAKGAGPTKPEEVEPVSTAPLSPAMAALAAKLHEMAAKDQGVRTENPISVKRMMKVDKKNHRELLRVYQQYGWPTFSMVGKQAAQDYWLLVQHQDLEFQKIVLPAMEQAVAKMEASKVNYAYLYDRVMVGEGKPQHWGTQGKCENGKATLETVGDPANLEERRSELGIYPVSVEKYLKMLAPQCANLKQ